jgi:hypothetical protein
LILALLILMAALAPAIGMPLTAAGVVILALFLS